MLIDAGKTVITVMNWLSVSTQLTHEESKQEQGMFVEDAGDNNSEQPKGKTQPVDNGVGKE